MAQNTAPESRSKISPEVLQTLLEDLQHLTGNEWKRYGIHCAEGTVGYDRVDALLAAVRSPIIARHNNPEGVYLFLSRENLARLRVPAVRVLLGLVPLKEEAPKPSPAP